MQDSLEDVNSPKKAVPRHRQPTSAEHTQLIRGGWNQVLRYDPKILNFGLSQNRATASDSPFNSTLNYTIPM